MSFRIKNTLLRIIESQEKVNNLAADSVERHYYTPKQKNYQITLDNPGFCE